MSYRRERVSDSEKGRQGLVHGYRGNAIGPVRVDFWHVHPGRKGSGESVQESLCWHVYAGDAQDIVNVVNHGDSSVRVEVCSSIPGGSALSINIESLSHSSCVAGQESVGSNRYKRIKVSLGRGVVRKHDPLAPSRRRDCTTAPRFTACAGA